MTIITLPWPPRELHPNARPHHMAKAAATKAYRTQAHWITKAGEINPPADGEIMLDVAFHPPSNRGDLDGMFAAIKAGLDGIADALAVNDRRFAFTIRRAAVSKNGAVLIRVREDV